MLAIFLMSLENEFLGSEELESADVLPDDTLPVELVLASAFLTLPFSC